MNIYSVGKTTIAFRVLKLPSDTPILLINYFEIMYIQAITIFPHPSAAVNMFSFPSSLVISPLLSWTTEDRCAFLYSHSCNMRAAAGGFSNEIFRLLGNQPSWLQDGIQHQNVILAHIWVRCPRGSPGARVRVWHTGGKSEHHQSREASLNAQSWPLQPRERKHIAPHTGEISRGETSAR